MNVSPIEVDRRDAMSKYGVNTKSSDIRKKLRFNHAPCNTVPIGYSDLGYSGCAGYSDLIPNGTRSSVIT